jgi:hypothetical protein
MGIIYRKRISNGEPRRPSWVEDGAPDMDIGGRVYVFPGLDPACCGSEPDGTQWHDVADGWQCAAVGDLSAPARTQQWADVGAVSDMDGHLWLAPCILTTSGDRAFRVRYGGQDYMPVLTDEQDRAMVVAQAARAALASLASGGPDVEMAPVCAWASELLSLTHQMHPSVSQALAVCDDKLALSMVLHATGLVPPEGQNDAAA